MTRGLRSLACVARLTKVDHILAHIRPIEFSSEEIESFINSEVTGGRVVMFELNNVKSAAKIVGNVNPVIVKEKTGRGKGKWKGRFGEDVGGEWIVREAENDIMDKGFRVEEGCLEHACSLIQ